MKYKNNGVTFWDVRDLVKSAAQTGRQITLAGKAYWVPARPLGWTDWPHRFKAIWMVWTGRADIVTWPEQ